MKSKKTYKNIIIAVFIMVIAMLHTPSKAMACPDCFCVAIQHTVTKNAFVTLQHTETRSHISDEFRDQEDFLLNNMFKQKLLPAWMMMTEQMTTVAMQQTMAIGTFFDAKQQLETQRLQQSLKAQAHRDYRPSISVCTFGTTTRSLAQTEQQGEYATFVLSQRSQDRQLGNYMSAAVRGNADDRRMRMRQFSSTFCRVTDNGGMEFLCPPVDLDEDGYIIPAETQNLDVNYGETVGFKNTLDLNLHKFPEESSILLPNDHEAVFALASHLFSNNIMYRIPASILTNPESQDELLDMRNVVAKRAVAEHSFNTIIGMKTQPETSVPDKAAPYMKAILKGLGITNDSDLKALLGDKPSYDAQMEVLTRRLYQQPAFYTNLYDSPANVSRQGVAMQAIGLMQNFDTWQSHLRAEAMLSVMLEMELLRLQRDVQNRLNRL